MPGTKSRRARQVLPQESACLPVLTSVAFQSPSTTKGVENDNSRQFLPSMTHGASR